MPQGPRCRLDLLRQKPRLLRSNAVNENAVGRNFSLGHRVIARNNVGKTKWIFGRVNAILGKLRYIIPLEDSHM